MWLSKQILFKTLKWLILLYVLLCVLLYFIQEKLIFFPERLSGDFIFPFNQPFEELSMETKDGKRLHSLLFTSEKRKGLIFYLHGNAGSLRSWGEVAHTYTDLGYDVFLLDYRGYGKSEGRITSEGQFHEDVQRAYDSLKARYEENRIVVLGYSIGTGPAARLASRNNPRLLILQAPYYSLKDLMQHIYPIIPTFLLKYKFETNKYPKECTMPVVLFHGDQDEVIYYGSSVKLKEVLKSSDTLITLRSQGHNGMTDNREYVAALMKILEK
jgi:pimeloyl-ACP methyl ester carboxylesterase